MQIDLTVGYFYFELRGQSATWARCCRRLQRYSRDWKYGNGYSSCSSRLVGLSERPRGQGGQVDGQTDTQRDRQYQCFFCKRIFSGTHILIFDWRPQYSTSQCPHLAFWLITKLKCAIIQWKNNDTKDYSEQLEFLNSQPHYARKKLLTSRQIFRYAVPARTVTKKALDNTIQYNYNL